MTEEQMHAWALAVEEWMAEVQRDLQQRLSVFTVPAPPRVRDFL